MDILLFTTSVAALVIGLAAGYIIRHSNAKRKTDSAEAKALEHIDKAKKEAEEIKIKGKEEALRIREEAKKEERERQHYLARSEQRLEKRESSLDEKTNKIEQAQETLVAKAGKLKEMKNRIESLYEEQANKLREIAAMTEEDAKRELLSSVEKEYAQEIAKAMQRLENEKQDELEKKAQDILTLAVQRCATSHAADATTTTLSIPSDDLKGRIIGREGRNIKCLENLTGCELIIDDTPETIVISGFDPIRRQVAKTALETLTVDGRIHPGRIEEAVTDAKKTIVQKIKEAGEAAIMDTGIVGLDPKLIQILGRLRYRTSYGQNVLLHSIEVAHLGANLASELGLDSTVAKKAGLLHDIGKALDHEVEGTHIEIGINLLKKFGVDEKVITAMKSHHEDYPHESNEAYVVHAADAISASRPGARRDTIEKYLNRLKELEEVATAFEGIEKAYAIQAGREVRVFVKPDEVDDLKAMKTARIIAQNIEDKLQYPGEIKVNVIREQRFEEIAK